MAAWRALTAAGLARLAGVGEAQIGRMVELAGTPGRAGRALLADPWGTPVKWLGDGVMLHFRDPAGAVEAALGLVGQVLVTAPVRVLEAGRADPQPQTGLRWG